MVRLAQAVLIALLAQAHASASARPAMTPGTEGPPPHLQGLCSPETYHVAYRTAVGIACAALAEAHDSPYTGQRVHIDLATHDLQPAVLPSQFVETLLLQPGALPERAVGGLEIEGGTIQGTLTLRGATINSPVTFNDVTFSVADPDQQDHAVVVAFSRFHGGFNIQYSSFVGSSVLVDQSTIDGNLFIKRSRFDPPSRGGVTITESRIVGDVEIYRNTLGATTGPAINFSTNMVGGNAIITQNDAAGAVDVLKNQGRLLDISGSFGQGLKIAGNDVRDLKVMPRPPSTLPLVMNGNFVKTDIELDLGTQWSRTTSGANYLSVSDNSVSGNLKILYPATRQTGQPVDIDATDIRGNLVGGDMRVYVPAWLHAASDVLVNMSGNNVDDETVLHAPACRNGRDKRFVDLSNTETQLFSWNIPAGCNLGWTASGFEFGDWIIKADFANSVDGTRAKDSLVEAWAGLQGETANPEMLRTISAYLIGRGYNEVGRDLLQKANESTYAVNWTWNLPEVLLDVVTYLYLLPTGYGAKPERALVILFVIWMLGVVVYEAYVWGCRRAARGQPVLGSRVAWPRPRAGNGTEVPGFSQFDHQKEPKSFSVVAFATDAVLPFINLHAYSVFYPDHWFPRAFSFVQHFFGWWMLTSFLASAAVLGA